MTDAANEDAKIELKPPGHLQLTVNTSANWELFKNLTMLMTGMAAAEEPQIPPVC